MMTRENLIEMTSIPPIHLGATDLRESAIKAAGAGEDCIAYRLQFDGTAETGWLLWVPTASRGGVAMGADSVWTDAESADDVLDRVLSGNIIT